MMCASCAFTLLVIKDGQFSRLNEKIKVQRVEISFLLSLHNVVGRIFTSMTFNTCCYSYECVISYGKRAFTNVIKFTNILTWKYRIILVIFARLNLLIWAFKSRDSFQLKAEMKIREIWNVRIQNFIPKLEMQRCIYQRNGDLNPTNSRNWILGTSGISLETDSSPATPERNKTLLILLFLSCETLDRNSSYVVLNFWPIEVWDNKWVVF